MTDSQSPHADSAPDGPRRPGQTGKKAGRAASRREFLQGKAAVQAFQETVDDWTGFTDAEGRPLEPGGVRPPTYLLRISQTAMACLWEVLLNAGQYDRGPMLAMEALAVVRDLEAQLTSYRDDSEVMELNDTAAFDAIPVEAGLFGLIQRAVQLHADSGGAYDITAGPLSKVWGFFRRQGNLPSEAELQEALQRVGSQHLQLDPAEQTVRFLQPGLEINLGSNGKGYALDRAAAFMKDHGVADFLIHGGQSSVLGAGHRWSLDQSRIGWEIDIEHPLNPNQRLARFFLSDRALGTSGTGKQFFRHAGKKYGHILDPRTGWPAEGVLAVTVTAPSAEQADALSTAFFVMGRDATAKYLAAHPEAAALIVTRGTAGTQVQCDLFNMPDGECELLI